MCSSHRHNDFPSKWISCSLNVLSMPLSTFHRITDFFSSKEAIYCSSYIHLLKKGVCFGCSAYPNKEELFVKSNVLLHPVLNGNLEIDLFSALIISISFVNIISIYLLMNAHKLQCCCAQFLMFLYYQGQEWPIFHKEITQSKWSNVRIHVFTMNQLHFSSMFVLSAWMILHL